MIYFILLLLTAIPAYILGSMSTLTVASVYVFRKNLRKLGTGGVWLSNFWRIYGWKGALKLLITELVRDGVPVLLGAILLSFKGHADVGRAFAVFCLVFGRLYPVLYDFRGTHATAVLIVGAFMINVPLGFAVLVFTGGVFAFTRLVTAATVTGAVTLIIASLLLVDNKTVVLVCLFTMLVMLVKHVPCVLAVLNGKEKRIEFKKDISYKLDEKF